MSNKDELARLRRKLDETGDELADKRREHAYLSSHRGGKKGALADTFAVITVVALLWYRSQNGGVFDALMIAGIVAAVALMAWSFVLKSRSTKLLRELEAETAALASDEKRLRAELHRLENEAGEGDGLL